jgi:hypothetical protein
VSDLNPRPVEASVELNVPGRPSRRRAMQWVVAAVAASALPKTALTDPANAGQPANPKPPANPNSPVAPVVPTDPPGRPNAAKGYGTDPKLVDIYEPGDVWPLTFTDAQRKAATALADLILPKDDLGPAASAVGVPAMLDEWVSAPYPAQQADRPIILDGLAWLDAESAKRFTKAFAELPDDQKRAICDDICHPPDAKPEFKKPATFFAKFRSLAAAAYYSTMEGWKAIGYVGNTPLKTFDGPPAEVLERLGVTQTVK